MSSFPRDASWTSETLRSVQEIDSLARDWNRLADRDELPMLRHAWMAGFARVLADGQTPHVVVLRRDGRVCAIAPLAENRRGGVRWLEVLGAAGLGEPSGVLAEDGAARTALAGRLAGAGRPLVLHRIRSGDPFRNDLRDRVRRRGLLLERDMHPSIRVPLPGTWEAFESGMSSRRRYDLRRARRRAESVGPVREELACPTPDEALERFEEFVAVERRGWKGRAGTPLGHNDRLREFFRGLVLSEALEGSLRVGRLLVGDRAAAMLIAVERACKLWILKIGYDEAFEKMSPGIQLTHACLRLAHDRGLDAVEFLGSEEPWQLPWSDVRSDFVSLAFYPFSPKGALALGADGLRFLRRRLAP